VRATRLASVNPDTQILADEPTRFFHVAQPARNYVGIPAQVSEMRRWYTVALLTPNEIASNTLYTADDPTGFLFGLLSSTMFAAWIRGVGGNIKSDLRYAKSVVHNTFPLPGQIDEGNRTAVVAAGEGLLVARAQYPDASLADLYDPLAPRRDILQAHAEIDLAVDRIFSPRKRKWTLEERLALLLERYAAMAFA